MMHITENSLFGLNKEAAVIYAWCDKFLGSFLENHNFRMRWSAKQ